MFHARKFLHLIFSSIIVLSLGLSITQPQAASAQRGDGIKRQVNAQSGKISFIGPESGSSVPASKALGLSTFTRPADPAMALAKRFAPEFGLKNPERDLSEKKTKQLENGRLTVRYQQTYQGIPVMGGELIVNTNANGDLYSMNGEVSPEFSLSTEPAIHAEQAKLTALRAMAKWYQTAEESLVTREPELWIYDESLLHSSTRSAELVWRMEMKSVDNSLPVRELILVNAVRGNISLHFNQIDTAWNSSESAESAQTSVDSTIASMSKDTKANQNITNAPYALVGTTWYVATTGNDSNSCTATGSPCLTINGAIGKAANGDTIKVASGTYTGTAGEEVVLIDNKSITLSGGWNASFSTQSGTSTIDGQDTRRGITVSTGTIAIDHFTIQNGFHAMQGGGLHNQDGIVTLSNNIVTNNVSHSMGGGIFNYGTMIINNTSIVGNSAGDTCCTGGGGGGGIQNYHGTVTLNNSVIRNNIILGGFLGSGITNRDALILNNSTVSGNTGGIGSTGGGGEGIYSFVGAITLNNSTISSNQSYGVLSLSGSLTLKNTIIAKNGGYYDCYDDNYGGTFVTEGYNLIGKNSSGCAFVPTTGDLFGTSTNPINARLAPLQDNGGSTFTHALMVGSPAINAGNPAAPGSGSTACLATDQRGVARPVEGRCDIGAYEGSVPWVPVAYVNTYTASGGSFLPGSFICNESDPSCATGDSHAKAAHKYSIGTYDLYAAQHGRDSIDNSGMTIISSVNYCGASSCPYYNAFWNGDQMVFGNGYGFALADDVVAHEYTHGVTQYESNLFYYYQSGAINESFSDLWGEFYDQTNGLGNDAAGVKWLHGEDVSGRGAARSMSNPPAFGDPDKMSSANYYEGQEDSGGVHTNSGVNNKAVYLMVDGGTFNGKTVTALGWDKIAAIYYKVNTDLLSSGADFSDLYYALQQACSSLIGQHGITAATCLEVKDAIDAVEMYAQPAPNFNSDVVLCAAGTTPVVTFADNLESGTAKWTFNNGPYTRWQYDSPYGQYAHSGQHSLYADDYPDVITDATARLTAFTVPSNAYLHFSHAYDFEAYLPSPGPYYYDGGVLEYSINGGSSWADAGPLMNFNGYDGTIYTGFGNPLSGRSAFAGSSHGYISTRLNLASLAGYNVMFRWRMGLDEGIPALGWWVDDVKVYKCSAPANVSVLIGGSNMGNYVLQPSTSTRPSYAGIDSGPVKVTSTNAVPIVAALRDLWADGGTPSSSIQLMGLPENQLSDTYWFPAYNNVSLDDQLRFGNVGTSATTVTVTIGGVVQGTYTNLQPNQGIRVNYPGLDSGPVKVQSSGGVKIIASIRDSWNDGTKWSSYSQLMGLPNSQLSDTYLFPAYNNLSLDDQLRFGNVGTAPTQVTVTIGGVVRGTYGLQPNESIRVNYPDLDSGPVKVQSSGGVKIIASIRDAWNDGTKWTSYFQLMGLPQAQLSDTYLFPAYENVSLDGQLRFGNVGTAATIVTVTINGIVRGTYSVGPSQSVRVNYAGLDSGPVKVQSSGGVKIIASLRDSWFDGTSWTSYSQLMGLPGGQLTTSYYFPAYNNVSLDDQLRIGVP